MKLTKVTKLGRYINPETKRSVNVYTGKRSGRNTDMLYFLRNSKRVFIPDHSFYNNWKAHNSQV